MMTANSIASLTDLHPDIIQTNILPRLDAPSLSTVATVSTHLNALCSDQTLWSQISRTTWPSITHPLLLKTIISHRSFFHDSSFPPLLSTHPHRPNSSHHHHHHHHHHQLFSAIDIRYQNRVIYSDVKFTHIPPLDILSSDPFQIDLHHHHDCDCNPSDDHLPISSSEPIIDLTVDEIVGADKATLTHLKQSLTLTWILIDPFTKRACNVSSVKAVTARADWVTNETHLRYVTLLPGYDQKNQMVQCKIHVVLGVAKTGLNVKNVTLKLKDMDSRCLNGVEFLAVADAAVNSVRRSKKMVDDEERSRNYKEFEEMKRGKKEWVRKKRRTAEVASYVAIFMCFFIYYYFLLL